MKYLIKNKKYNNYYKSYIKKDVRHFVVNIDDAYKFGRKKLANEILNKFNHKENFEIVVVLK